MTAILGGPDRAGRVLLNQGPAYELLARATDDTGQQPDTTQLSYLFDAVVRHPVTVT